ncbi:retrovirus-related pol polyprotein from transposon TNT 1-94 [Tanacetum coccineum]
MKGILRQFSVARTPQQNGVAKRRNRTLIEAARTMLAGSKLPTTFWAEAVNIACYVQNRVLVVKLHNKTPYEIFHGITPTLSFMRPFGCPITILNTIDHIGKFDGKAVEGFFVGYSLNSKAFRVFNSRTRIVEENLHIRFSESTPNVVGSGPDWLFDIDALTRTINYEPIVVGTQSNGFAGTKASDNADPNSSYDDGSKPLNDDRKKVDEHPRKNNKCNYQEKEDNINITNNVNAASINKVNAIDDGAEAGMNNLDTTIQKEPEKVIHALKDPSWIEAMQEELLQFKLQEVWTLVDLPNGKRAIGTKWVFRNKKDKMGTVIRNKARLVAQGYTQEEGIDYDEIEKEVYVYQPPRFEDPDFPDRVYKVEKSLYGLHQAPRAWHKGDILLVQVYVDDIIFGSTKKEFCFAFEKLMHEKFQMSFMGELTLFLGLQLKVKTASTPMETQKPLLKDEDVCACARYQVNPKVLHLHAVKRIFKYLKGQPKLGLWYPKDYPFDLVAYTDSDYARASLDIKSTTEGKVKKGVKLMMEKLFRMELELLLFWSTVKEKTINGEVQLHALVDGKKIIITKSTVRGDLQLEDAEGFDCLPNSTIFEQLILMDLKTTAWNEFSSTIASVIICLATNQKFNFSKFIFEGMIRNLDNVSGKFLMYLSDPSKNVVDEAVHKELGDSLVRAATTASSLEAEQDSVWILEKTKTTQQNEIASLKRRVKKLEKKSRSRTHKLNRLYKVGLKARVESSEDEEDLGEDASKQGMINVIDADEDITLINVQDDADNVMFDVNVLNGEEVFVTGQNENVVEEVVDAAQVSTVATTVTITTEEIPLFVHLYLLRHLQDHFLFV